MPGAKREPSSFIQATQTMSTGGRTPRAAMVVSTSSAAATP